MATRREESDGRVVLQGRRKAVRTARGERGGKATTASERAGQRDLFHETADTRKGPFPAHGRADPHPVSVCGAEVEEYTRNDPAGDNDGRGGERWKPDTHVARDSRTRGRIVSQRAVVLIPSLASRSVLQAPPLPVRHALVFICFSLTSEAMTGLPNLIADMNGQDLAFTVHDGDLEADNSTPNSITANNPHRRSLDATARRLENFTRVETFGDSAANGNNDVIWLKVSWSTCAAVRCSHGSKRRRA
jgi:hypothetical protein